jgi:NADPH:quinone reductase-like Zn-dependent oxidoreductase
VITTASPRNHDLLKKLGAVQVFDYNSATVVSDIVSAFQGRECAGAFSIGDGAFKACITIVSAVKGRNFVAQATIDKPSGDFPQTILQWPSFLTKYGAMKASELLLKKRKGVDTNFIWASDVIADEVGKAIYQDFLPLALENGSFVPAPEPLIVGNGLETIAAALGRCKQGVSAQKVVVKL